MFTFQIRCNEIKCKFALFENGVFEMRRDKEMRQIALRVSIALAAGMFSIVPVTYGAPVGHEIVKGGASVTYSDAENGGINTSITSNTTNNIIDWQDFSVAQGETVQFDNGDKTNNYMNVVTGANTSQINGAISGGNEVYIINPNGVIFGETASVDVGSLYASTRGVTDAMKEAIEADGSTMESVINTASAGVATDVVNMGSITANKVVMEGQNIRFYSDNVTSTNGVVFKADAADNGYVHVGNSDGSEVTDYSSEILTSGSTAAALEYYKLVDGTNWSTAINNNLSGNYMLSADIDATDEETDFAPITNVFSGKLDGNFHTISNISNANGLFYQTSGAAIENIESFIPRFSIAAPLV